MPGDTSGLTRRDILKGVSVGAVSSLSGCPDQGDTPTETQTDTIGPLPTPTPTIECPPVDYNLNTGYNADTNGLIADYAPDTDWTLTADDINPSSVPKASVVVPVSHPNFGGWPDPFPNSKWISPNKLGHAGSLSNKTERFAYEYCFCLNEGFEFPELDIKLQSDDEIQAIQLNGTSLSFAGKGGFQGNPITETYTSPDLFQPGQNCLSIIVADTEGYVTGMNLIGRVTAENADCECETGTCDLGIEKHHNGNFVFGGLGTYIIDVCNEGDAECTEMVEVEDELPPGTQFDSAAGSGWSVTPSGGTLTLSHPNSDSLDPGECLPSVEITVQIPSFDEFSEVDALSNCATLITGGVHTDNDRDCDTPCVQGKHTFVGGNQDNFGGSIESASPSQGLQMKFGPTLRDFDEGGIDSHFGHTFDDLRPSPGVGEICRATLDLCLQPAGTDLAFNDNIQLGVWNGNGSPLSQIWTRNLGTYQGTPGLFDTQWHPDHTESRCIQLDLSALPEVGGSTLSLLGVMNNFNRLSLHVQDDTVVDYAELNVTYCCAGAGGSGECDLSISKTTAQEFHFGQQGTYYITVCNQGEGQCDQVEVMDDLPDGLQFVSGSGSGWSVSAQTGTVTATHAGPAPGDCLPTLALTVQVPSIDEFPAGSERIRNCVRIGDIQDCVQTVITPE